MIIDLHSWLVDQEGSFVYGFLYIGLLLASLIFYYSACLVDPGYVDSSVLLHLTHDDDEVCTKKLHHHSSL